MKSGTTLLFYLSQTKDYCQDQQKIQKIETRVVKNYQKVNNLLRRTEKQFKK